MRFIIAVSGILLMAVILAAAVLAHGPNGGWGFGYHMMDQWNMGPGYHYQYGSNYGNLSEEDRHRLEQLERKFHDDMSVLQSQLWEHMNRRDAVLDSPNPDIDEVQALHKRIREIQAQMDDIKSNYELEVQELIPRDRYGSGQGGWGYGGNHMGGYGHMMGGGGFMGGGMGTSGR